MNRKKINIEIGRFQPFTNGHLKCAEYAYKELGVPTIVCMINVKDEKVDAKHPFPTSLILPLYNDAFKKNDLIEKFVLVVNADIVKIGEMLYQEGYEIVSWSCGTDRIAEYSKMAEKYAERAHLSPDFKMLEIKRTDDDISATKVRQALLDDDKKFFDKMTPFGSLSQHLKGKDSVYEILKNQINAVMSKNESLNESHDADIISKCEYAIEQLTSYKNIFTKDQWYQIEGLCSMYGNYDEDAPHITLKDTSRHTKLCELILIAENNSDYSKIKRDLNNIAKWVEKQTYDECIVDIEEHKSDDYIKLEFIIESKNMMDIATTLRDALDICKKYKLI